LVPDIGATGDPSVFGNPFCERFPRPRYDALEKRLKQLLIGMAVFNGHSDFLIKVQQVSDIVVRPFFL